MFTKKTKGALLKPFIIGIKAGIKTSKNMDYQKILSEDVKLLLNTRILDSAWYPYETFKACFIAVSKIEANNNLSIIQKWGHEHGKAIINKIYRNPLLHSTIQTAIISYNNLFKLWFNFGTQKETIISDNEIHIIIEDFESDFKLFYYITLGWIKGVFESYLKIPVSISFLEKSWENGTKTVLKMTF